MKWIGTLCLLFFSTYSQANCELSSWRFHTIAVYEVPPTLGLVFSPIQNRDGGLLFLADKDAEIKKSKILQKLNGQFGFVKIGAQSVSLDGAVSKSYASVKGNLPFLKPKEFIGAIPNDAIAVLDPKLRTLMVTSEKYLPLPAVDKKPSDPLPGNLAKVFKATMSAKDFTIVSDIQDYSGAASEDWSTQKLGEKNWELVHVKAKLNLKTAVPWKGRYGDQPETSKIKTVYAWLAFLTNNGKDFWYIGNSSGDPCGNDLKSSVQGEVANETAYIGGQLKPLYGLRATMPDASLIYSFGDANIVYYLNFGKDMVVVSKETYR